DTVVFCAVVWDGPELVAMLPFVRPSLHLPLLQAGARAWQSTYSFSCTPVLDRPRKDDAASALLDVLASACAGEWMVPRVNTDGEGWPAFLTGLERKAAPWRFAGAFSRASLTGGSSFEEHMDRHVSAKR